MMHPIKRFWAKILPQTEIWRIYLGILIMQEVVIWIAVYKQRIDSIDIRQIGQEAAWGRVRHHRI